MIHFILNKITIMTCGLLFCSPVWAAQDFPSESLPGTYFRFSQLDNLETSGIAWSSAHDRMFVVSDNGYITTIRDNDTHIKTWARSENFEAVTTVGFKPDFIYLGVEEPGGIIEFNVVTGKKTRTFNLTEWMDGSNNKGLEALTFVPDESNPEGGLFYAGLQKNGDVYVFSLPIKTSTSSTTVTLDKKFDTDRDDLSDLYYCPIQNILYALYDSDDLLVLMKKGGKVLGEWKLPGDNQEGITVRGTELYITQDNGNDGGDIIKYAPFQIYTQPDQNSDGKIDLYDFGLLAKNWLNNNSAFDISYDGENNLEDLEELADSWLLWK